jgi:hypothetical protein
MIAKIYFSIFLLSTNVAIATFTEKEIEYYQKNTEISSVRMNTIKNDDRERFEQVEINTFRYEEHQSDFQIYMAVEITDKEKNRYFVEFRGNQGDLDSAFTGEEYYTLLLPHGDLGRLKVTAYVIQYGVLDKETFILLAEDFDDVESISELKERSPNLFPNEATLKHYHIYDNGSHEESIPFKVRNLIK